MSSTCYAPLFKPRSSLECLIERILAILILVVLVLAWLLSFGNPAVLCQIRRLRFRIQHCREGNADPRIDLLADAYTLRVREFRDAFGKDTEWELWMEDNRDRYLHAFNTAASLPTPIRLAFRYDSVPIAYTPPWPSEADHMAALETLMELSFPGFEFVIVFEGDPSTAYGSIIAGIPTNLSHAAGRDVYLYYESIIVHEFAHVLGLPHHYDSDDTVGDGLHMPPGETKCEMDRTTSQFCSGCRTALGIPLDVDNEAAIAAAGDEIRARYPY